MIKMHLSRIDIKQQYHLPSLRVPCHKTMVGSLFIATELDSYLTSFCWCLSLISRSVTLLVCRFNFRENSSLSLSRVSFISLSKKQIKYIRLGYLPSHSHPHRPAAVRSKGSGDEIATVCAHAFGFIARKRNGKGWKLLRLSIKSNPPKWPEMEPKCLSSFAQMIQRIEIFVS